MTWNSGQPKRRSTRTAVNRKGRERYTYLKRLPLAAVWVRRFSGWPTFWLAAILLFAPAAEALTYPHLPIATVDVTCCPPITRTVAVHTAAQLQAALDDATLGDEIVLDAGITYEGNFILRVPKGTSGWVTVRTSATASLPPPGTRVSLSDAPHMAKVMSPNFGDPGTPVYPALANFGDTTPDAMKGVHHYRFIGLEIATGLTSFNYHTIMIIPPINGTPYTSAGQPHDIIFDRCLIHGNDPFTTFSTGDTTPGTLNGGVVFDAANGAIVDSKLYNFWGRGNETQALGSRGAPGPQLFQNNEISGGAESYLTGGALLPYNNVINTDITFVHNYFNKPLAWQADPTILIKNLFELKVGKRVRLTDNLFEGVWVASDQFGYAVVITPRPAQDSNYNGASNILLVNEVSDILVSNNVFRKVGGLISNGMYDGQCTENGYTCVQSARLLVSDNMADYDTTYSDVDYRGSVGFSQKTQDLSVKRNTLIGHNTRGDVTGPHFAFSGSRNPCQVPFGTNFEWVSNITDYGGQADCNYDPADVLGTAWGGTANVANNLIADLVDPVLATWISFGHGTQVAATAADIQLSADELTLQPASPFFGMGIGANLSCFNEAAIRAGTPSPLCPLPSEAQSGPLPPDPTTALASGTFSPRVYPNPWRSDKHTGKSISFDRLVAGGTIKIFTTSGHMIKEIPVTSWLMPWNLDNERGDKVASGIYVYLITDGAGNKAKGKVAVIK